MKKRKLSRIELRNLLIREAKSMMGSQKRVNEGIFTAMAGFALATLALAALTGVEYLVLESSIDKLIASDDRVKAKLAKLENLVKENPNAHPAEIAEMAAKTDAELAQIIYDIKANAMGRHAAGTASSMATGRMPDEF